MFTPHLEHVFAYTATLKPAEVLGPVPEGLRAVFHISGGTVQGPRLNGTVRAFGADWFTLRRDGVGVLDVRAAFLTHDGAEIHAHYNGLTDLGPQGYEDFVAGRSSPRLSIRTTPVMRTAHPAYEWMQRCVFVGIGEADLERNVVSYDVYAVG